MGLNFFPFDLQLLVDTRLATLARLGRRATADLPEGDKDKSQEIGALIQALREAQVQLRALPSQVERDTYQARQGNYLSFYTVKKYIINGISRININ